MMDYRYATVIPAKPPLFGKAQLQLAVYRKTRWFTVFSYRRACGAANKGYRRAAVLVGVGAASSRELLWDMGHV
jgi:hypothetical protein